MVALKVQTAGRDDAEQRLQRRKRHRRLLGLRQARALAALHIGLVLRWLAITLRHHRLAQPLAVGGQFQNIGVALCWYLCLRLRMQGHRPSGCRRCGKSPANKAAAARLGLGKNDTNICRAYKILRCLAYHPGYLLLHKLPFL